MQYNFWADLLNKFSQFTPWVQVAIIAGMVMVATWPFYFVATIARVFIERNKPLWQDKRPE